MNTSENNRESDVTELSCEEIDGFSGGVSGGKNKDWKSSEKQNRDKKYCPKCLMMVNVVRTNEGTEECPFCRHQFK